MDYKKAMYKTLEANGCVGTGLNPGGRYFTFNSGGSFTVPNYNEKDDYQLVVEHLRKTKNSK